MKTISIKSTVVFSCFSNLIIRSRVFGFISNALGINRFGIACVEHATKLEIPIRQNHYSVSRLIRCVFYFILILLSSTLYLSTANATTIVETFKSLDPGENNEFHKQHKSDLYEVWVKPIKPGDSLTELNGIPDENDVFNPKENGFKYSFTYKSVNDIASNDTDEHSKCYQYYYKDPDTQEYQYRSEAIPEDLNNEYSRHCKVNKEKQTTYDRVYEQMTHSNNWTTFDVGTVPGSNNRGAVRIYIQLNSQHKYSSENIKYDIRPKHAVTANNSINLHTDNQADDKSYKFIKVRKFGEEYVQPGSIKRLKKILVIDVLQPVGTLWSGQFNVSFNDTATVNKQGESAPYLHKHPLFIFANPLPQWYHYLGNKFAYNGCPEPDSDHRIPNNFYTHPDWIPGKVVQTKTYYDSDGNLFYKSIDPMTYDGAGSSHNRDVKREVNDFILLNHSKQLCIPGGVYVKGRIIHDYEYHKPDPVNSGMEEENAETLHAGDPDNNHNAKGVKIVGRGILSGIDIKFRDDIEKKLHSCDDINGCKTSHHGGGWNGHLIDVRHKGAPINTDVVGDVNGALDCYERNAELPGQDVNCVQGITMVDSPRANIFTGGSRMDVENVKIMGWHIKTNGITNGEGNKIKNAFIKVNDDAIVMGKSGIDIDNVTVWRQYWGSVVNLSWNLKHTIQGSRLNGLNVIRFDKGQRTNSNGNAAIVSSRNVMGGTIKDFEFKNIIVEDPPYEIINLQLNDTRTYYYKSRPPKSNSEDGTGNIQDIRFDGLFTQEPYKVTVGDETNPSIIQKSIFGIYDGDYFPSCARHCEQKFEEKDAKIQCYESCKTDPPLEITNQNLCPVDEPLTDDSEGCACPDDYKLAITKENGQMIKQCVLIERSISAIQLNNICVGNKNQNTGIDTNNIDNYFEFRKGVIKEDNNVDYERGNPYMGDEVKSVKTSASASLCMSLTNPNTCTLANYRNSCSASQ